MVLRAEIESLTPTRVSYLVKHAELHRLVALRRTLLADVQGFGFDTTFVNVDINHTVLPTVVLQDAIGQLPIRASERLLKEKATKACVCSPTAICDRCGIRFELGVVNDTDIVQLITSDDFELRAADLPPLERKLSDHTIAAYPEKNPEIHLLSGITIVKLNPQQRLHVVAIAKVGCNSVHARFSPITVIGLEPDWEVQLFTNSSWSRSCKATDVIPVQALREIAHACPQRCYTWNEEASELSVTNSRQCTNCTDCRIKAEEHSLPNLVSVSALQGQHRFAVETMGTRDCLNVIVEAGEMLVARLLRIRAALETLKQDRIAHPEASKWISLNVKN